MRRSAVQATNCPAFPDCPALHPGYLLIGWFRSLFLDEGGEVTIQGADDPPFRVLERGQGAKRAELLKDLAEAYGSS